MISLWQRALEIIPGGNQLVSKRPDRYCPNQYPSHYTWAHGNNVTDTNGKVYKDYATMGIGTCTLGYGNAEVDAAVIQAIASGNMSSLNPIEELELAEEMLKLNPKMDMIRFARTGGGACAIAARIAETYHPGSCAYSLHHGYSGWLLGNPERGYGLNFKDIEDFEYLTTLPDGISYVIMEPVRNYPDESYPLTKSVRKWCTENGVPLIFDEITSGFRVNIGGYHVTKDIYPDIAVYGKALGNGYAISAVLGTREIMESAEDTFISSTFWTEKTGYAAGLATLEQMKKHNSPSKLIRIGKQVQTGWKDAADITGLEIEIHGIPPLAGFTFVNDPDKTMTFYTQEMLKRGYLASGQFYASLVHTEIDEFLYNVEQIFTMISEGNVKLDGPVKDNGWKRSN